MKAVLGIPRQLSWFNGTATVVDDVALLTARITLGGQLAANLTFTQCVEVPELFFANKVTLYAEATYDVVVSYSGTVIDSYQFIVSAATSTDYAYNLPVSPRLSILAASPLLDDVVSYRVVPAGGAAADLLPTTRDDTKSAFVANDPVTFATVGAYVLVWYKNNSDATLVPFLAQDIFILNAPGKESVTIWTRDPAAAPGGSPLTGVTVVVSTATGTQLAQGVTDNTGMLALDVPPGNIVLTLLKSGVVFSVNNFGFEVVNTSLEQWVNTIPLETSTFAPTVSGPAISVDMCTLFLSLYGMDGLPLPHADIQVGLISGPGMFSGAGVFDTRRVYKTDSNGHAVFDLVQGIQVEVVMPTIGLRRLVTVPSGSDAQDPVNLLTLLEAATDQFTILTPSVLAAPRRTL